MSCQSENRPPSQIIREAIANKENAFKVEDLINAFGSQSFGLVFIVVALPLTIPLPPGVGFIPAALLCVWAFQRALGGTLLWLPKAIGQRELSEKFIKKIETKALPLCERLETKFFHSNQPSVLNEIEIRLASMVIAFFSIFIMLPTPFLNSVFALIIILMGLTVLNSNRKLLWINMSIGLLALLIVGYVGSEVLFEIGN